MDFALPASQSAHAITLLSPLLSTRAQYVLVRFEKVFRVLHLTPVPLYFRPEQWANFTVGKGIDVAEMGECGGFGV